MDAIADFEPDYDESGLDVAVEKAESFDGPFLVRKHKRQKKCPVCFKFYGHVKRHVLQDHLPFFVSPETACFHCSLQLVQSFRLVQHQSGCGGSPLSDRDLQQYCSSVSEILSFLSSCLGCVGLGDLAEFAKENVSNAVTDFSPVEDSFGQAFLVVTKLDKGVLRLLNWRVLASLVSRLQKSEQAAVHEWVPAVLTSSFLPPGRLVDAHLHLERLLGQAHKPDLAACLSGLAAPMANMTVASVVNSRCWPRKWFDPMPPESEGIRVGLAYGIHPCEAHRVEPEDWLALAALLGRPTIKAVGEMGWDSYHSQSHGPEQETVLRRQAEMAQERELPIVLHCRGRRSEGDSPAALTRRILSEVVSSDRGIHFHCYNFSAAEALAWLEAFPGAYFGISAMILQPDIGPQLREVVSAVGLGKLLLETDAPYLVPRAYRGMPNHPGLLPLVVWRLAEILRLPPWVVCHRTSFNAEALYRL